MKSLVITALIYGIYSDTSLQILCYAVFHQLKTLRLYPVTVRFLLCRLWMFLQNVQHGVMQCQEEYWWLNFTIEEATVVQFLQDVSYRWGEGWAEESVTPGSIFKDAQCPNCLNDCKVMFSEFVLTITSYNVDLNFNPDYLFQCLWKNLRMMKK